MLTGKTKYLFYKYIDDLEFFKETNYFFQLPFSMQYGVYVDFFWLNKIPVTYDPVPILLKTINLNEAREQAILKANEILNSNLK